MGPEDFTLAVSQACNSCGWLTADRLRLSLPLEMASEKSPGFQRISSYLLFVKRRIEAWRPFKAGISS